MDLTQIEGRHHQCEQFETDFNGNREIGKYCIFQQIDGGAQAKIYRGKNKQTQRQIAVKVFDKKNIEKQTNFTIKTKMRRLMKQESRFMMMVDSQYVVKCYECFENQNYKLMMIEYCNGGTLWDKIETQKKIPQKEAIEYLKQILNGISALHQQKIMHRDIKLQNIFLHNGICKLGDFGFAKHLSVKDDDQCLKNTILGSIGTMAPEVFLRKHYGLKADIWSLGVIFYSMLFGMLPFQIKPDTQQNVTANLNSKIQEINSSEVINGVKLSNQSKTLLKVILVVDQNKRIGWKSLLEHEIFNRKSEGPLNNKFTRVTQINKSKSQILQQNQKEQISQKVQQGEQKIKKPFEQIERQTAETFRQEGIKINEEKQKLLKVTFVDQQMQEMRIRQKMQKLSKNKISDIIPAQQIKQQDSNQNKDEKQYYQIKKYPSRFMEEDEIEQQKLSINHEDSQFYQWGKVIYSHSLRAECIFQNIFKVIHTQKLLDPAEDSTVQMMFYLISRCYNEISPINSECQKRKDNPVLKDLHLNISNLFGNIVRQFDRYKFKIFKLKGLDPNAIRQNLIENQQFINGIEDFSEYRAQAWKQLVQSNKNPRQKKIQKQNQKQNGLFDYTRNEQIELTCKFIKQNLDKLKEHEKTQSVKSYLTNFRKIFDEVYNQENPQDFKYLLEQIALSGLRKKE